MFKHIVFILILLQSVTLFSIDRMDLGYNPGQSTQDYAAGLKYAKEKNLPVMLDFTGSDWCYWCLLMNENVFSKTEWKDYITNSIVHISIDFPQDESIVSEDFKLRNSQLQMMYGVRGYPTYVILNSSDLKVLGTLGAGRNKTPETFIKEIQDLL